MNLKLIGLFVILLGGGYAFYNYTKRAKLEADLAALRARNRGIIPRQGDDWVRWVAIVTGLFGTVKSLWEPGGIFYNSGVPDPNAGGDLQSILNEAKNLA